MRKRSEANRAARRRTSEDLRRMRRLAVVGDNSDEPRLSVADAEHLLGDAPSAERVLLISQFVRGRSGRRQFNRVAARRGDVGPEAA